jgi:hypothetical protein
LRAEFAGVAIGLQVRADAQSEGTIGFFQLFSKKGIQMTDRRSIPESLADVAVQQKLAKARQRTRVSLAKKLKVSEETVLRTQRRIDLYLSILEQNQYSYTHRRFYD